MVPVGPVNWYSRMDTLCGAAFGSMKTCCGKFWSLKRPPGVVITGVGRVPGFDPFGINPLMPPLEVPPLLELLLEELPLDEDPEEVELLELELELLPLLLLEELLGAVVGSNCELTLVFTSDTLSGERLVGAVLLPGAQIHPAAPL